MCIVCPINAVVGRCIRKVQVNKQPYRQEERKGTSLAKSFIFGETSAAQSYSNGSSLQCCLIDYTIDIPARNFQGKVMLWNENTTSPQKFLAVIFKVWFKTLQWWQLLVGI